MESIGSKLSGSEEDVLEAVRKTSTSKSRPEKAAAAYEEEKCRPATAGVSHSEKKQAVDRSSEAVEKPSSEVVEVLLKILLQQEELTVQEYTLNSRKFKVLVIEDTEL